EYGSRDFSALGTCGVMAAPTAALAEHPVRRLLARTHPRRGEALPARNALHARPRPRLARQIRQPAARLTPPFLFGLATVMWRPSATRGASVCSRQQFSTTTRTWR